MSTTKASEIVAAAEIVYYALKKIDFFVSSSEAVSASAKVKVRISIRRDGPIKLRPGLS